MCESILYKVDLVGASPKLLIFKNQRYKSILSSLISLLIIIISIIFIIYTLIEYFKYQSPIVVYSKDNDQETNRTIYLKDSLLIFQLVDTSNFLHINNSIAYYEAEYTIQLDDGTYVSIPLIIENCEIGKNIDIKYKDYIESKYKFNRKITDFYCINFSGRNLSLFYLPNAGFSSFKIHIVKKNENDFPAERIQVLISSENDLIDHFNKTYPISQNHIYHFTSSFSSKEFTNILYNFQYIKYDSDEGFFYKNSRELKGMSFSDMSFYRSMAEDNDLNNTFIKKTESRIGTITININNSHFDNYQRSYQKLQSLLAEIMSVISLLFEIGGQISIFLCKRKMSKDIIFNLLNNNSNNNVNNNRDIKVSLPNKNINILNIEQHRKNEIFNTRRINKISSNNSENINFRKNLEQTLNKEKTNKKVDNTKINSQIFTTEIMKKINYLHIIKSFFCFNDKKTKLIDLCHSVVTDDISIERIMERLYNLEKAYHYISRRRKEKFFSENKKIKEIKKYIYDIYLEEKNQKEKQCNIDENNIK